MSTFAASLNQTHDVAIVRVNPLTGVQLRLQSKLKTKKFNYPIITFTMVHIYREKTSQIKINFD